MLDYEYCIICKSKQLGPCQTPDDAAQCPMWSDPPVEQDGQGVQKK